MTTKIALRLTTPALEPSLLLMENTTIVETHGLTKRWQWSHRRHFLLPVDAEDADLAAPITRRFRKPDVSVRTGRDSDRLGAKAGHRIGRDRAREVDPCDVVRLAASEPERVVRTGCDPLQAADPRRGELRELA